jgi:putative transcriptional regulator
MNMNEHIKNIIYELRKAKGVTQEDLADSVNVSRQTIISIEKGTYTPSLLLAIKISMYFKLKIENIFTYEKK